MKEKISTTVLHKVLLICLKVIPMLLALTALLNTVMSYFDVDATILSYIAALLVIIFLYIASYAFHFCTYYRMFLHYFVVNLIVNTIDYYWGIPVSDRGVFMLYFIITGVFIFLLLYYHQKCKKDGSLYR